MHRSRQQSAPYLRTSLPAVTICALVCSLAWLLPGVVSASPGAGFSVVPSPAEQASPLREQVSLDEAVRIVRERSGGRILRAETQRQNGRAVHRIRVLSEDGRVRNYRVDAETGRVS